MDKRKEDFEKIKQFMKNYPVEESGYTKGLEVAFFYENLPEINYDLENGELLKDYYVVDSYGGEGQGDTYYMVYYFPKAGIFIKFNGWYASYSGSEYSDMYLVEPKEVTITEYHIVK